MSRAFPARPHATAPGSPALRSARGNAVALAPPASGIGFLDSAAPHGPVLQAVWVDASPPFQKWTPPWHGRTWWFNRVDRTMASVEATEKKDLSAAEAKELEWRSHKQWQIASLEGVNPDALEPQQFTFSDLVRKGTERWKNLKTAERKLDAEKQAARDWYFREYYDRKPLDSRVVADMNEDPDLVNYDIESNYNARPASFSRAQGVTPKRRIGQYSSAIDTKAGVMVPNQTYALGTGEAEVYYNPRSGNAERMPASEIHFQQWRIMAAEQKQDNPVLKKKEETVAGDAVPMLATIRTGAEVKPGEDKEFLPEGKADEKRVEKDKGFEAMLAIPNVTASVFLIMDHGEALGIRSISKIVLRKNGHIEVYFC